MSEHPLEPTSADVTTPSLTVRYRFGDFEFSPGHDVLWHYPSQSEQKLEPKVGELLTLLLSQAGRVVEQEQLQQALWPSTVVEQNSLYQLLTKLRRLLDDSTRQPRYIKTVPKKGYCWIATVTTVPVESPARMPPPPHAPPLVERPSPAVIASTTASATPALSPLRPWLGHWRQLNIWQRWMLLMFIGAMLIGVRAVASLQEDTPTPVPTYEVSDVSYALGIEMDVDAHAQQDLLAYVKDVDQLQISDKQGQVLFQQAFDNRIAKPSWHPTQPLLAFWFFRQDRCELQIRTAQGAVSHIAAARRCVDVEKPVWLNDEELVLVLKEQQQRQAYLYRLSTQEWVPMPLPLADGQRLVTAVRGWQDRVYYVVTDRQHRSVLMDLDGKVQLRWPYPVWLIAFDPSQGAMVTNDNAKHAALQAKAADGRSYTVFTTAQGLFSSVSIDSSGTLYTGLEAWQVDIRDKDNVPIFSTTSIDYLPVSNALGETAFMSRRSGVCEVYLHSQQRIQQLSNYQGYDYVNFLEWRPDLSMLVSNRDRDLVLYDRQNTLLQFPSQAAAALVNIGWVDDSTLFSFDGATIRLYNLQGRLLEQHALSADNVYFDHQAQRWLVHKQQAWYQFAHNQWQTPQLQLLVQLTAEQSNHMQNIRIRGQQLYWQSDWSKHDLIWQLPLHPRGDVSLLKSGNLIWHFDVTAHHELTIAQMDTLQGDIKKLVPQTSATTQDE